MSVDRAAPALARLADHEELHLPLPKRDVLGRLALKFLWRRQVKWQIEANQAIREALGALADQAREDRDRLDGVDGRGRVIGHSELAHEVGKLQHSVDTITAGLNQRLYSALGRVESQLGDLRLRIATADEAGDGTGQRLKALETQVAALGTTARDVRLRHAQLDVFLDAVRTGRPAAEAAADVPSRDSFLELALSELLDGPAEQVRLARQVHLPVITGTGVSGPVFDAAPGRGEWLEVLRGADVPFRAASANGLVRRHCAGLGLTVEDTDPLDALAATAPGTLSAVTAFRFAERLDPDTLARFADLAGKALRSGGVLLVELPGESSDLGVDPYARQPLHPLFLRFLAESAGFAEATVTTAGERLVLTARR